MIKILRDLVTGKDGVTHDLGRWSWIISTVTIIGGAIWNALHNTMVNLRDISEALGLVVAAHGGALWAKKDTEPQ